MLWKSCDWIWFMGHSRSPKESYAIYTLQPENFLQCFYHTLSSMWLNGMCWMESQMKCLCVFTLPAFGIQCKRDIIRTSSMSILKYKTLIPVLWQQKCFLQTFMLVFPLEHGMLYLINLQYIFFSFCRISCNQFS